ncbi:MAG: hypothetical protein HYX35_03750 [Proteobacteria bacterium]|nr:hypothetical protein [Pseudomonadota bacterium]
MNLKILSAAFLMSMSATALLAQTISCNQGPWVGPDTSCKAAVTVYNSIMSNAVATSALAGMVNTVQNTTQPAPQGDPLYIEASQLLKTSPGESNFMAYDAYCKTTSPMSQACTTVVNAANALQAAFKQLNTDLSTANSTHSLSNLATAISNLAPTGTLEGLVDEPGTAALATLVSDFNTLLSALEEAYNIQMPPCLPPNTCSAPSQKKDVPSKK